MEKGNDDLKNKKIGYLKASFLPCILLFFSNICIKENLKPPSNIKREYLYEKGIYIYPVYTPSLNSCIVEYLPE